MAHILFATIGSLGDLHPCLALGLELKRRGHSIAVATTPFYRDRVQALGFAFHPMRPDWRPDDHELIRKCEDITRGPEILIRRLVLPHLPDTYTDLLAACSSDAKFDLMIAGELVYAAPLVAEKLNLRWVSAILSPSSFLSAHDPSVLVSAPGFGYLRNAGWHVNRLALELARVVTRHWWEPVRGLRRKEGLRPTCEPLTRDKFSQDRVLALFSKHLASPQPDWPRQTLQPGFVFYDHPLARSETSLELPSFLAFGKPPIVFTLGSTAVHNAGNFFEVSAEIAIQLGRRAVLLGAPPAFSARLSNDILAVAYAPYSQVFPHAAAIVHQGGSGTTAEALRAGRPMLIVPYGWDQPDNGARVERLGAGLCVPRTEYTAVRAAPLLARLLDHESFAKYAARAALQIQEEQGLYDACNAIEVELRCTPKSDLRSREQANQG